MEGNGVSPEVSVCMAAYNGEKYISDQIRSILDEIGANDELIVVDDASSDSTVLIVEQFADPRIRLIEGSMNLGHVGAFEVALTAARGRLILLSDQDDVWVKGRVAHLREFQRASGRLVVASGFENFRADGSRTAVWPTQAGAARDFTNLIGGRQAYYGCAMGLRREILPLALPFPKCVEAHDHWLAVIGMTNGGVAQSPAITVERRIHDENLSPTSRRSAMAVLHTRAVMVAMLVVAIARRIGGRRSGSQTGGAL